MSDPRGIGWEIKARSFARCDHVQPWRDSIRITGEEDPKPAGKIFLEGVVLSGRLAASFVGFFHGDFHKTNLANGSFLSTRWIGTAQWLLQIGLVGFRLTTHQTKFFSSSTSQR
jgi:hypothetical protein